jgi:phosphoenolpyruvate synthase/pyruvate phosphate dikinase
MLILKGVSLEEMMSNSITVPKYFVGVADRFAHYAKAQRSVYIQAIDVEQQIDRRPTFIGNWP